ncbi:MAG: hypothetical protein HY645_06450 [Acidobacteria bacterium]|nr:hypothetical protein [Acidobacteriota bacterium]
MMSRILFFVYIIYCFEVGVFLLFFPWIRMWEQNALLTIYPFLRPLVLDHFFRGAVSGLGAANLILGVWEIAHFRCYFRKA